MLIIIGFIYRNYLGYFLVYGKHYFVIDRFNRYVSGVMHSVIHCFIIKAGVPSWPAAELFNVDITVISSAAIITCIHILFILLCTFAILSNRK